MATAAAPVGCIGPYTIIRQLGSGGMGEVFLGHDPELGRNIAIKLLPEHLARSSENLASLRQESYVLAGKYRDADAEQKQVIRESVTSTVEQLPAGELRERVTAILDGLR